jgi:hypothetical protein
MKPRRSIVALLVCTALSACGGTPEAPVAPTPSGLRGDWIGTTDQGQQITLSISSDLRITSMTIDYLFPDCSGSLTFSGDDHSFYSGGVLVFSKSLPAGPSGMSGHAMLRPDNSMWGGVALYESGTCRGGGTQFTARKK